jgi:hypothetical protein
VLVLADWSLILFHTALVIFNCIGWAWRATRRWHLVTLALTAFSWLVLGLLFGAGYCICTDLHWRVRQALGQRVTEDSYVQYLVARLTGWTPDSQLASTVAGLVFAFSVLLSLTLNVRDARLAKNARAARQLPLESMP